MSHPSHGWKLNKKGRTSMFFTRLGNLFKGAKKVVAPNLYERRTGREIDMRHRGWGHNLSPNGDGSFMAWTTPRLQVGDTVITENGRFLVSWAQNQRGVDDMTMVTFLNEKRFTGAAK